MTRSSSAAGVPVRPPRCCWPAAACACSSSRRPGRAPTRCPPTRSCAAACCSCTAGVCSTRSSTRAPQPSFRPSSLTARTSRPSTSARAVGVSALRAPRRTVLDALLLEAARAAGAEVRVPARVTRLLTDGSRVRGIEGIERGTGTRFRATAPLTIGADGRNSTIAQAVDAPFRRRGTASGAIVYGYFPGLARDRYHWAYRPGVTAGVVPTGDGLACVWAGTASAQVRPTAVRRARRHIPVAACRGHPGAGPLYRRHTTRRYAARLSRPARLDPRVRRPGLGLGR